MEVIRKRVEKNKQTKLSKSFQEVAVCPEETPTPDALGAIPLDEAAAKLPPKPEKPEANDNEKDKDDEDRDEPARSLDPKRMQQTCAGALLDDRDEELKKQRGDP